MPNLHFCLLPLAPSHLRPTQWLGSPQRNAVAQSHMIAAMFAAPWSLAAAHRSTTATLSMRFLAASHLKSASLSHANWRRQICPTPVTWHRLSTTDNASDVEIQDLVYRQPVRPSGNLSRKYATRIVELPVCSFDAGSLASV